MRVIIFFKGGNLIEAEMAREQIDFIVNNVRENSNAMHEIEDLKHKYFFKFKDIELIDIKE